MRMIKITALVLGIFSLWGCSQNRLFANYRELDQTELIQTLGMDRRGETVSVTVASSVKPDGSYTVFTGDAQTIARALSRIHTYPTKKFLFFGHINNIIIGSDMLNNMADCLDFIERSTDLRLDSPFFIVRNSTAKELMREASVGNARVTELLQPLTDESNLGSDNHVFTAKEIISVLTAEGYALAYAVTLTRDEDKVSQGRANIIPAGYGVIKKGRVIGYIEYEDCLGVNLLINEAVNGILEIPDSLGGFVSLSLAGSKAKVSGRYENGELSEIIISIKTSANIEQLDNSIDIGDEKVIEELEKRLEDHLSAYCQKAIQASRELETDFLGLGKRLSIHNPLAFEKISEDWANIFPNIPINVEIEVLIERTYDIMQTGGVK